jgi:hypothetical protein
VPETNGVQEKLDDEMKNDQQEEKIPSKAG